MKTGNKNVDSHLAELLKASNLKIPDEIQLNIHGEDPVLDSPWRIGEAASTALGAMSLAVAYIFALRKEESIKQKIDIDILDAALSTYRCHYMKQNGYTVPLPDIDYPTVGMYKTADEKHIFINGGYPALRRGLLKFLNSPDDRNSISEAIMKWQAGDIEKELQNRGLCCAMCRSPQEWLESEHGKALYNSIFTNSHICPVQVEKISDSEPQPFKPVTQNSRPLSGVKVLDITHVLAGPTCGMMLAEQDADVMRINGPQIPSILPFVMDTGHGKLNVQLDLKTSEGRNTLWNLIDKGGDVLSYSYRPGKLDSLGFSPEEISGALAKKGKGIIYASINCYGHKGPWKDLPGWEQLAQAATGLAHVQGSHATPKLLPTYPDDYITGYLAAYGILCALKRRAFEGGSYHVKVSLCATAMWLQSFGKIEDSLLPPPIIDEMKMKKLIINNDSTGYGALSYFGHPVQYSVSRAFWKRPTVPIGYNKPQWPED